MRRFHDLCGAAGRLITISNQDNAYVVDMMKAYTEHHEPVSVYKFLFASLSWSPFLLSSR